MEKSAIYNGNFCHFWSFSAQNTVYLGVIRGFRTIYSERPLILTILLFLTPFLDQ
jgi:hypothetical protein